MVETADGGLGATPSVHAERDGRADRGLSSKVASQVTAPRSLTLGLALLAGDAATAGMRCRECIAQMGGKRPDLSEHWADSAVAWARIAARFALPVLAAIEGQPVDVSPEREALADLCLALTMARPERALLAATADRERLMSALENALRLLRPRVVARNPDAESDESIAETERRHHLERQALSFGRRPPEVVIAPDRDALAAESERA